MRFLITFSKHLGITKTCVETLMYVPKVNWNLKIKLNFEQPVEKSFCCDVGYIPEMDFDNIERKLVEHSKLQKQDSYCNAIDLFYAY